MPVQVDKQEVDGTIKYSNECKIYAYNGDMITTNDYDQIYYEYDENGNITDIEMQKVMRLDGKTIIPAKIFAQAGIIRPTYITNQWTLPVTMDGELELVKITERTVNNITNYGQGIGSGAGNLESSNGTYTVDASMN